MERSTLLGALLLVLVACRPVFGIGGSFSLSNAHVDPSYTISPNNHRLTFAT